MGSKPWRQFGAAQRTSLAVAHVPLALAGNWSPAAPATPVAPATSVSLASSRRSSSTTLAAQAQNRRGCEAIDAFCSASADLGAARTLCKASLTSSHARSRMRGCQAGQRASFLSCKTLATAEELCSALKCRCCWSSVARPNL